MQRQQAIIITLSAILLVLASAGAASYLTKASLQADQPVEKPVAAPPKVAKTTQHKDTINWDKAPRQVQAASAPAPQAPPCNDNNIVGTLAGGVGGGLVGSQFGKGNGKTAAAVLGAVGGAALGNNMIPTQNVTCR